VPEVHRLPRTSLSLTTLVEQQRVYYCEQETSEWRVGRIVSQLVAAEALPNINRDCYSVQFPNSVFAWISPLELHVRIDRPIANPVELLAARINETPFWHAGRSAFLDNVYAQRKAYRGLTAL